MWWGKGDVDGSDVGRRRRRGDDGGDDDGRRRRDEGASVRTLLGIDVAPPTAVDDDVVDGFHLDGLHLDRGGGDVDDVIIFLLLLLVAIAEHGIVVIFEKDVF